MSDCVDSLSDHFNPWALTYVGLYGYGFLDAGRNATELFRRRGWTTIVSDDLVANVLLMFGIVVGGVTGCFGVLMQRIDNLEFSSYHEPTVTAFM
jgi:Plasma-membrane choline transporter